MEFDWADKRPIFIIQQPPLGPRNNLSLPHPSTFVYNASRIRAQVYRRPSPDGWMLDFTIILQSLDYLGTFAFGVSGAMVAVRKKMDVFGVIVLAMVTAIGGGTVRDLLIARTPNFWIQDSTYIYLAIIAGLIPFIAYHAVERGMTTLIFFDAVGLGAFTVIGAWLGIQADVCGIAVVVLATLTGIGGGIMRDVLAREVPIVLREEIYASACIIGGTLFLFAIRAGTLVDVAAPATVVLVVIIRMLSHKYKWELPRPRHTRPKME